MADNNNFHLIDRIPRPIGFPFFFYETRSDWRVKLAKDRRQPTSIRATAAETSTEIVKLLDTLSLICYKRQPYFLSPDYIEEKQKEEAKIKEARLTIKDDNSR